MAIGRVSGSMLVSNLDRQGTDLQFTTNSQPLVYMNFAQFKLGVNTSSLSETLTINGNLSTTNFLITGSNIGVKSGTLNINNPVNLGDIGNVKITGGTSNYIMSTDGAGNLTWANLQTLTMMEGFDGNNIPLGSNTVGSFSSALTFTTTTKVTDAIASLNQLMGNITNSTGSVLYANGVDIYANLSSTSANVNTLFSNAAVQATWLANLDSNVSGAMGNITTLQSNAATQASYIDTINSNVSAANVQISSLQSNIAAANVQISSLFSNAAVQATWLGNLDSNVAGAMGNITTLQSNAATQATYINTINSNISAANSAISVLQTQVYSNANAASYLTIFNGNINAGNIGISGNLHVDYIAPNVTSVVSFTGSSAIKLPSGDALSRPSGVEGYLRFNSDSKNVEFYDGTNWVPVSNTVTDQTITGDGINLTYTLDQVASSVGTLVSINGTLQQPGVAYSVSGNQITFAEIPLTTDIIDVRFLGGVVSLSSTLSDDLTVSGNIYAANASITSRVTASSILIGTSANTARFPNASVIVSGVSSSIQQSETAFIGLIAEGVGRGSNYGHGLYGVGYSNVAARGTGVTGEAHVTASTDTGSAIGVRGYSNDTHASGLNVGLYADASGSSTGNYALYVNAGDIASSSSIVWNLVDNLAAPLTFDTAGKTGILKLVSTDNAEGVTMSGTLGVTGNLTAGNVTASGIIKFTNNANVSSVQINGTATKGGTGYHDFLSVTNQGGGTNPNKYFRLTSSGGLEIIDSTYNNALLSLADSGDAVIKGNLTVNGTSAVITPNKPAFRVYGSSSSDISGAVTVSSTHGTTIDYNQGSYYDNTSGLFTAPVAGLYHCYATLRVGGNNGLNQASIQKNSSGTGANVVAFWETDTNTGTATHFSMTGYAKLAVGDTIRLRVLTGKIQLDSNDSWGVTHIG